MKNLSPVYPGCLSGVLSGVDQGAYSIYNKTIIDLSQGIKNEDLSFNDRMFFNL